ncbi:MAG: ABC transporter ATP-binding protein, partial [Clostridiales bacterium]|nr:ABC transporter ATP-binding protein [Clostridiales bacterium]
MKNEKIVKQKPTHSTTSNNLWVFRRQWKYARLSFVLLLIMIPVNIGIQFLNIYLPKVVVANVIAVYDYKTTLLSVGSIVGGLFLLNGLANGTEVMNLAYFTKFRLSMHYELFMKHMTVAYQTTESVKFRNMFTRAQEALWASGMHGPLTRMSQSATELIRNILGYLLFGTIISFINPWIAVILTLTPIVNYFFTRRYNDYEHANRDKWTPLDRKLGYIVTKSADFDSAKDIRIYGLNKWFSQTYKSLANERLSWDKKLMSKSFTINLADLIVILLRDGFAYYILISMTLRGEITVDYFVLYFAAIGSFATWIGGIIGKWNEV